jgi:ribosomal protein S6
MNIYETLILSVPEITDDECTKLETQLAKIISKVKGETVSFEKWGKYKLSYPVKKNEYGIYFLTRYKLPDDSAQDVINELRTFFTIKFNEIVMREMTCVLNDGPLEYSKPKALEDLPDDAVDSFLRENKMEGLLKKDAKPETKAVATPKEEAPVEAAKEEPLKTEAPVTEEVTKEKEEVKKETVATDKEENG